MKKLRSHWRQKPCISKMSGSLNGSSLFDFFGLRVLCDLLFKIFFRPTSHCCERTKKPRGVSHAPRGSYLLVEVSQSHLRNASAASIIQIKECRSQSLRHSASLATTSPPLSHGETHNGGQSRCVSARFILAADSGGPKPEREVSRSVDRLAIEGLEMFWNTARLRSESHRRQIAEFMPKQFVAEPPHSSSPCRQTETARHKRHGISARQGLPAGGPASFRKHQSAHGRVAQ